MFRMLLARPESDEEEDDPDDILPWQIFLGEEHDAAQCSTLTRPLAIGTDEQQQDDSSSTEQGREIFLYQSGSASGNSNTKHGQCVYRLSGEAEDNGQRYWIWVKARLGDVETGRERLEIRAGDESKHWLLCHHNAEPNMWAWQRSPFSLQFVCDQEISLNFLTFNIHISKLWLTTDLSKKPPSFQPDLRPIDFKPCINPLLFNQHKPWTAFRTPDSRDLRIATKLHRRYILTGLKSTPPQVTTRTLFIPDEDSEAVSFNLPFTNPSPRSPKDATPRMSPQHIRTAFDDGRRGVVRPQMEHQSPLEKLSSLAHGKCKKC